MKAQHLFLVAVCAGLVQAACGSNSASHAPAGGGFAGTQSTAGSSQAAGGGGFPEGGVGADAGVGANAGSSNGDTGQAGAFDGGGGEGGTSQGGTSQAGGSRAGGSRAGGSGGGSAGAAGSNSAGISFFIDVPGAERPIPATVSSARAAPILVQSYPTSLTLPVTYSLLPVGYEDAFSDAFCADVLRTAKLATLTQLKELVRRMLRQQGRVTAQVPLSSVMGPRFEAAGRTAAQLAGAKGAAFIDNPLTLSSAKVTLELAPDAISNILGDLPTLVDAVSTPLAQQAAIAFQTGVFSAAIPGKDLWCDLAQGKAALHFDLAGKAGGQPYAAETIVSRVKRL